MSTGIVRNFISTKYGMSVVLRDTTYFSVPIGATCSIMLLHVALCSCSFSESLTLVLMILGPFEMTNFSNNAIIRLSIYLPYLFLKIIFIFSLVGSITISFTKIPNPIPFGQLFLTKFMVVITSICSRCISNSPCCPILSKTR